jgi:DDE superfamily endonuclease
VVLVEDNGPIHTSKLSLAALAARAHWLIVEWLPRYAPELNDIERVGHASKRIISRIGPSLTQAHSTGDPPGSGRAQCRAHRASVGRATNLCLADWQLGYRVEQTDPARIQREACVFAWSQVDVRRDTAQDLVAAELQQRNGFRAEAM